MNRRNAKTKERQLEKFLMNVADNAEAALREYWQEREAEILTIRIFQIG